MYRRLNPILPRPSNHFPRGRAVLDAAKSHLAQEPNTGRSEFFEILFLHARLDARGACMHFDAARTKSRKNALGVYRHRFQPDDVTRAAGRVYFSSRNHRGYSAVQGTVDPAQLVLARRPITSHRMHMTVDKTGSDDGAVCVNDCVAAFGLEILLATNGRNPAIDSDNGVAVEDRPLKISAENQANVADHQFGGCSRLLFVKSHAHA